MANENVHKIFVTLGASNHTDEERQNEDYYATDPIAAELLYEAEKEYFDTHKNLWENCCGQGHLAKVFESKGMNVTGTDLIDRGYGIGGVDFLKMTREDFLKINPDCIVTNPPYQEAQRMLEHALKISNPDTKIFFFLKVQFLESKSRRKLFDVNPPEAMYVFSKRVLCAKNGDFEKMIAGGGSAIAYAWYRFSNENKIDTPQIKWIN
jgi:predicted RNA methylase